MALGRRVNEVTKGLTQTFCPLQRLSPRHIHRTGTFPLPVKLIFDTLRFDQLAVVIQLQMFMEYFQKSPYFADKLVMHISVCKTLL